MIVWNDLEPSEKVKVYDRGVTDESGPELYAAGIFYRTGDMWAPHLSGKEALLTEMEHFIDCVSHGREPITSGRCGLAVVQTLEAAMLSLRQRGQPIDICPARMAS